MLLLHVPHRNAPPWGLGDQKPALIDGSQQGAFGAFFSSQGQDWVQAEVHCPCGAEKGCCGAASSPDREQGGAGANCLGLKARLAPCSLPFSRFYNFPDLSGEDESE